jgi:hypothetical protein
MRALGLAAFFLFCAGWGVAAPVPQPPPPFVLFGDVRTISFRMDLTVTRPEGEKKRAIRVLLSRGEGDAYKLLLRIVQPQILSDMKYLAIVDSSGAGSSWIKTSKGLRALPKGGANEPLFDSDLTSRDLMIGESGTRPSPLASPVEGESVYLIATENGGSSRTAVIETATGLLKRLETRNGSGVVVRQARVEGYSTVAGIQVPMRIIVEDLERKSRTLIVFGDVEPGAKIPESSFSKASL